MRGDLVIFKSPYNAEELFAYVEQLQDKEEEIDGKNIKFIYIIYIIFSIFIHVYYENANFSR